jgi:lactoylglutathione lyase
MIQTLISTALLIGVAMLLGFRPTGGLLDWIAEAGLLVLIAFALTWLAVLIGLVPGIRFTTPDAEADHSYLRANGVDADEVLRWEGVPLMFAFRDQDGNGMEIVEQR